MKTKKISKILLSIMTLTFIFGFQIDNSNVNATVKIMDEVGINKEDLDFIDTSLSDEDNEELNYIEEKKEEIEETDLEKEKLEDTEILKENGTEDAATHNDVSVSLETEILITNSNQLLNILNQSSIDNQEYLITENMILDSKDLSNILPNVKNSKFIGSLSNTGNPVTIRIQNSNTNLAIRQLFGFFDSSSFESINIEFQGNVRAGALVAKSASSSIFYNSNILIQGNVEEELNIDPDNYIAAPLFNVVNNTRAENIMLTVNGHVGNSDTTLTLSKGISSSGFLVIAQGLNTFKNIDVNIRGGVYAIGNNKHVSASGFASTIAPTDGTTLVENVNVNIGSEGSSASVIANHGGDPYSEQSTTSAGFVSNIEYFGYGSGNHEITFNNNSVNVYGDIIYDMSKTNGSSFINMATGFGKVSTQYTGGKSIMNVNNTKVMVRGAIKSIGYAHTISAGAMIFLSSSIEGEMKNNNIHVGSLHANAILSTPTSTADKRASAIGFAYGGTEKMKIESNAVEVNGNIEAISDLNSNTHAYATGFGFSNVNMVNNDVTVNGDIISDVKDSTTKSSSAFSSGLSVTSNGTINSDIYVTGSIIAKSSRNAYANGLTAQQSGVSELNKIEVNGNIEASSSVNGYAGASGYSDYVGSGTIHNNSVHVEHKIVAKSSQNAIASGFINITEKDTGPTNVYIKENIMRSEGNVYAQTNSSALSDVAIAGGFISQVGSGVDMQNNGVYIAQESVAESQNEAQKIMGDFIAQVEFTNLDADKSTIENNTLLTRKTNDTAEHYYHFIGQYDDSALPTINDNFVTLINGKARTAYALDYNTSEQRWDFVDEKSAPLGKVRIENTVQKGPTFNYILDSNLNDLEILPTHDTTKLVVDINQFPILIQTDLDRVPHEAVDDHVGDAKIIYDIIGIQDPSTEYKVTINKKEHVTVGTSKSTAFEDEEIRIDYTLDNGYELDSVIVKNDTNDSNITVNPSTLMFKMPESSVTVTVNVKPIIVKSVGLYLPDKTVYVGDIFTLTPSHDLQNSWNGWTWDTTYLSANFDSSATFTALKVGVTYVEYQLETGENAKSKVTILDRKTDKPGSTGDSTDSLVIPANKTKGVVNTGDKMNTVYLVILGMLSLIGSYVVIRKHKKQIKKYYN